jgi:hypothetical protein
MPSRPIGKKTSTEIRQVARQVPISIPLVDGTSDEPRRRAIVKVDAFVG